MTEKQLLALKAEIDEAKNRTAEIRGQITALTNQLKTDYGCKTIAEAEKKSAAMLEEITTLQEQIEEGVKELKGKYGIE